MRTEQVTGHMYIDVNSLHYISDMWLSSHTHINVLKSTLKCPKSMWNVLKNTSIYSICEDEIYFETY